MALIGFGYFFYYLADGHKGGYGAIIGVVAAYVATRVWQTVTHDQSRVLTFWWVMIVALALLAPFVASGSFRSSQLAVASYTALGVMGLNLLTGYTGLISLGHSAFVGIGAYGTAIMINSMGMNIVLAMAIATACAALAGLLIGVPALRLTGSYLAIATLGLTVVFVPVMKLNELDQWTGGVQGLALFRLKFGPPIDASWLENERWYYFLSLTALVIGTLLLYNLLNSAAGRSFRAVRDSEVAAAAMGINVARTKLTSFMLSAAYAGFAGGLLFLVANRFVSPDSFTLTISIEYITAVAIGGRASLSGSLIGGFFLIYIYREGIETVSRQTENGGNQWLILLGFMVTVGILFGNRTLRTFAANLIARSTNPLVGPLVNLARFAIMVLGGLLLAVIFRLLTSNLLDVTLLRGLIIGTALIIIILFLPGGFISLLPAARALNWRRVGRFLRTLAGLPAAAPGTADRSTM